MPWCPKCKCEYKEGITECADCKVPLVDEFTVDEPVEEAIYQYEAVSEEETEEQTQQQKQPSAGVYQDKKAKAEDFKSSAYTLLIVGILGIAALVLIEIGVLPIHLAAPGKYITYGVMGGLFLIFIIMGISSFRSSRKYAGEAEAEDELTQSIKDWALQNLTKEYIIGQANKGTEELPQEMQYFNNYAVIKDGITAQFGELDAVYLDALCEEIYGLIFDA